MKDYLVRGIVESKNCRVFACQTTNLLEEARAKHGLDVYKRQITICLLHRNWFI